MRQLQQNHRKQNLYTTSCLGAFIIFGSLTMSPTANAQHLRLAIGQYACTTNSQCGADEYCDIDSHECKGKPVCETCEICEECAECETCPTPITCGDDEYNVNGICVECISDGNCASGQHCSTSGRCVECITDDDCAEKCDTGTNECKTCAIIDSSKPYWNETTKSCESCPNDKPLWNGNSCVTCASIDATKPLYDSVSKTCKTCYEMDSSKPMWNGTSCEACPDGQEWDTSSGECQMTGDWECRTNADCGLGRYCHTWCGYSCTQEFSDDLNDTWWLHNGVCQRVANDIASMSSSTSYVVSNGEMTWWSARRFCEALGKSMVSLSAFNCAHTFCASGCDASSLGYCHADTSVGVTTSSSSNKSALVNELYAAYGSKSVWTSTDYDSCDKYIINLNNGYVNSRARYGFAHGSVGFYALCQ